MILSYTDWAIIIIYFVIALAIGLWFTKKAGKNMDSFFLGGRNLPWWIAGTSMVATTFAADTPLLITELVANNGISGNWLWWNGLIGGMLATFFFARYWRKANIITDVELTEIRYSGAPAKFLRGFKAVYLGILMNSVVIAWVNIALAALLKVFFNIPDSQMLLYLGGAMLMVVLYSGLSGMMGVAVTDFFQFILAMTGCIILAFIVVNSEDIGGMEMMKTKLSDSMLNFFPNIGESSASSDGQNVLSIGLATFVAFIAVQWWASWYPGAEPGGGGYVAQRMMSAKNEKHAVYSTLFFQIMHHAIRPWPWIVVALCATILYPELSAEDSKLGYVYAMRDYLPDGLRGLLLAAFLAAYMSTISTQLNWGASYIVNDLYKRFIKPDASDKKLIAVSRINTLLLMIFSLAITSKITSLEGVFKFMIECGAGVGAVLILRWYWWRINAWSEIVSTIAPFISYSVMKLFFNIEFPYSLFITVGFTTFCWVIVTFITAPTDPEILKKFYERVSPRGWWGSYVSEEANRTNAKDILYLLSCWVSSVVMAYSFLILIGNLVLQNYDKVAAPFGIAVLSLAVLLYCSKRVNIFSN